ncbi:mitochondrial 37S ribosomal protein uS2m [Aspergillus puulaauensis]|uniref:37S ribosomal protein, mitochondrial n=1 Tax=Aspergillus puulaauensis TaxID=1220207 RepID=A0A7R7XTH4_9EURO|nr:37S ribosomal protein, mitochondrial [Aspergillus puulaauensis]BCS27451.1 37S ribosomal protein, mitochondrial [Aspergillus puulaauensis]
MPSQHQKFERKKRNSCEESRRTQTTFLKHDTMIVRHLFPRQGRQLLALNRQAYIPRRFSSTDTPTSTPVETIARSPVEEARPSITAETPLKSSNSAESITRAATETSRVKAKQRDQFHSLGTTVGVSYKPEDIIRSPPSPSDITLELLLASQTHLGHSTSRWNPQNSRYIFGIRDGIHIISLDITAAYLRRAAKVVEEVAVRGGLILFAGTRPGQKRIVVRAAELAKSYHLFERWIPGSLTNGEQILGHCDQKVVNLLDQEVPELSAVADPTKDAPPGSYIRANKSILKPDLVVCLNPLENEPLLHECGLNNVPTIGIIDTDADATKVTYPIPANDDSLRSVGVIAGVLGRAGQAGQKRRMEKAKRRLENAAIEGE